jgi:hypothetical protein
MLSPTTRSVWAVASPPRTNSTSTSIVKPSQSAPAAAMKRYATTEEEAHRRQTQALAHQRYALARPASRDH